MIAFQDSYPLVCFSDGRVVLFEKSWLSLALSVAAERAGYKKWWLATHVTESVADFLERDFEEGMINVSALESAVRSVLQSVGYGDVAGVFRILPPPARISLAELARAAGHGYELAFFELLRARMRDAIAQDAGRLEITDAHAGIKMLRSAKAWRRDCSGLLEEVVGFVRGELDARSDAKDVQLQLS